MGQSLPREPLTLLSTGSGSTISSRLHPFPTPVCAQGVVGPSATRIASCLNLCVGVLYGASQEKLRTAGRASKLCGRGVWALPIKCVYLCPPWVHVEMSLSLAFAICISFILEPVLLSARVPNSCLSQFWVCQEPNIMSRVLKIGLSWLRLRSRVCYLGCRVCFVYT